jgi:flagellar hook-associated protein 2
MALSTNMVSGLSSGIDWRTMIDQLIAVEHRSVDLVENQKAEYQSKLEIYQATNTKLLSFKTQADILASSEAFNVFKSTLATNSSTYSASDLISVSTGTSAVPGSHTITMNANSTKAEARQISSKSFTSFDTALDVLDSGFLGGEFIINSRAVDVEADDTLTDIRDKINNLNTGTNATGVTASILTVSSSNYRLVLSSENTGEDAFTISDASADTVNILETGSTGLGFTDGTTSIKNYISNGVQSEAFSNSTQAVGSMLGLNTAQSGTVTIGAAADPNQFTVSIDLSKSLTDIAGDINTAAPGGSNVIASVFSSTEDGVTTYRLKIENTTTFVDAENVLETLGILEGGQSSVAEVHLSDTANILVASGGPIVDGTQFNAIDTTGVPGNDVAKNDTITIFGTDHNGNAVSGTFDPANLQAATVGQLLDEIEAVFGLAAASVTIDANGKIRVEDDTAGDSQLSISLVTNNEGGGTLDLGTMAASTEGYVMEVQAGQDANIIIDGTAVTSSNNIIDDVIAGVTLNLLTVDNTTTTTINLNVSRDYDSVKSSVQTLLDRYNDIMSDINAQFAFDEDTQAAGILQGDGTLSSIKSGLVDVVVSSITGLSSTTNALSLIGISTGDDGNLSIDDDLFKDAFNNNFNELKRVFIAEGSTTDGDVEYITHTNDTAAGDYEVEITQAATQATNLGTTDLSSGLPDSEILTITDTVTGGVAEISFSGLESLTEIVNDINSEMALEYTELLIGDVGNDDLFGGSITNFTKWSEIDTTSGPGNDINDGDTIGISGTKRNGISISGTYAINDADDTVQGFLSYIENLYNNTVSAYFDTDGKLVVEDNEAGNSQLSIVLDESDAGSLDFGSVLSTNSGGVEGRHALDITASANGDYLQLTHNNYGSSKGFTISQRDGDLGLVNGAHAGLDVAGTINAEAATGSGQNLKGDAPGEGETTSVEGLVIKYTGSGIGSQGNVKITMGVAELFDRVLYDITNIADGYLDFRIESLADRIDGFDDRIEEMEARLDRKMEMMTNRFVAMELALSQIQNQSQWLANQLNASFSGWV